jgi:hypothetical protein
MGKPSVNMLLILPIYYFAKLQLSATNNIGKQSAGKRLVKLTRGKQIGQSFVLFIKPILSF